MKRTVLFSVISIVLSVFMMQSCKKREQPRYQWLIKTYTILDKTSKKHNQNITNIKNGRDDTNDHYWGDSLISENGPAGYDILAKMGATDLTRAFRDEVLPGDTISNSGMIPDLIDKYLEYRHKKSAGKAYEKLRLAIHKDYYEFNTFHSEWILSKFSEYLVNDIGGSFEWVNGTRNLEKEKEIAHSMTSKNWDNNDPWGCNCSPECYNEMSYKKVAEGNNKSAVVKTHTLEEIQNLHAMFRYKNCSLDKTKSVDDYKTKYDPGTETYYVELD